MTSLSLANVSVRYETARREAFEALSVGSLAAQSGKFTVIGGPSGSGKSTLIMVMAGLLVPDRGQVLFGDTDLTMLRESARDRLRRHSIGLVFQDFQLIAELSPLANVLLPASFGRRPAALRAQSSGAALRERAIALLNEFGVPMHRVITPLLSRGEQQRVALARALLFDPPVILCDEPAASLDAEASSLVAQKLQGLAHAGKTVLAVSHDPVVQGKADRLLHLTRGQFHEPAVGVVS